MCVLFLPVSTEILHSLFSKCDVICVDDSNSGLVASREAGSEARTVGWGQEVAVSGCGLGAEDTRVRTRTDEHERPMGGSLPPQRTVLGSARQYYGK